MNLVSFTRERYRSHITGVDEKLARLSLSAEEKALYEKVGDINQKMKQTKEHSCKSAVPAVTHRRAIPVHCCHYSMASARKLRYKATDPTRQDQATLELLVKTRFAQS